MNWITQSYCNLAINPIRWHSCNRTDCETMFSFFQTLYLPFLPENTLCLWHMGKKTYRQAAFSSEGLVAVSDSSHKALLVCCCILLKKLAALIIISLLFVLHTMSVAEWALQSLQKTLKTCWEEEMWLELISTFIDPHYLNEEQAGEWFSKKY